MKIAFVSQGHGKIDPPAVTGSISIWTFEVINELKKSHAIVAYEMDGGSFRSRKKCHQNVTYFYAPTLYNRIGNRLHVYVRRVIKSLLKSEPHPKKPEFLSVFHNLGYILWVSWHLRKQKCDVAHIHQYSQYIPVIRFLNYRLKIILHMHSEWASQLDSHVIGKRIEKADLIVGCSEYISQKISDVFPIYKEKVATVFNGVHHWRFKSEAEKTGSYRKDGTHLLFVGRVSPEKGVHILIGAVRKLVKRYPTIQLNIVGGIGSAPKAFIIDFSGEPKVKGLAEFYPVDDQSGNYYRDSLKNLCADGLESNVFFKGAVPYQKVFEYYRSADILVNPSFSESFGMSLAEAMSAEKPVVATRVGGMVNVVDDGKTGILVEPGDECTLADAIARLIDNPSLRNRMGKAGRERILRLFSWEQVARKLETEYMQKLETVKH